MTSAIRQLSRSMKPKFPSIKTRLGLPSRSVRTELPVLAVSTPSRSVLSAGKSGITTTTTATKSQSRRITTSASMPRFRNPFDDPAQANKPQLPRDSDFEARIKSFHSEYCWAEQSIALTHPLKDQLTLGLPSQPSTSIATNFGSQMELLATLEGIKPCTLFCAPGIRPEQDTKPFFAQLVREAVLPGFKQYELDRYGFSLFKIPHHLYIEETGEDWRNCWVLADCRSEYWGAMQSVFLPGHDQRCPAQTVGYALGYPALPPTTGYDTRYVYFDMTATRELAKRIGNCGARVVGLTYRASGSAHQMQESREDFERYYELGRKYGREYAFHFEPITAVEHSVEHQSSSKSRCISENF